MLGDSPAFSFTNLKGQIMIYVAPRKSHESFETFFNRFKRIVEKENVMDDYYKHEFYEKPSKKRNRKRAAAIKRQERLQQENMENRTPV